MREYHIIFLTYFPQKQIVKYKGINNVVVQYLHPNIASNLLVKRYA
jgi:hypothetical protein